MWIGRHPNTEERALMNPSQAIEPEISFCVASLPENGVEERASIAYGLHRRNQEDQCDRYDGIDVDSENGEASRRQREWRYIQRGKIYHTHGKSSDDISCDEAEEHGELFR